MKKIIKLDQGENFQISCFDWDSDGSHDFIGAFTTNLREMCSIQPPKEVNKLIKLTGMTKVE